MNNRSYNTNRTSNTSRNKLNAAIRTPLDIFGQSKLFSWHNSRNYSTNCLTNKNTMSTWSRYALSAVLDGYADPLGGTLASFIKNNNTTDQHRIFRGYPVPGATSHKFEIYWKPITAVKFGFGFGGVNFISYVVATDTLTLPTSYFVEREILADGWIRFSIRHPGALTDGTFRIYPFSGTETTTGNYEECLIYIDYLNNGQPISLPDLSGNNKTFNQNTAGGVVDNSNATIARFGQPSISFIGAQGYILNEGLNEDYTGIVIGALDSRRVILTAQNECLFDHSNVAKSERHILWMNVTTNKQYLVQQYTQSVAAGTKINYVNPNYNDSNLLIYNCFFPVNGSLTGNFNNGQIVTTAKVGADGLRTKMVLGNGVDFNVVTAKQHLFESIIIKGSITAEEQVALNLYIKQTYNQSFI